MPVQLHEDVGTVDKCNAKRADAKGSCVSLARMCYIVSADRDCHQPQGDSARSVSPLPKLRTQIGIIVDGYSFQ